MEKSTIVLHSQAVPSRDSLSYLMGLKDSLKYHEMPNGLAQYAHTMGIDGDYIQPANRFGQVNPVLLDSRGHQSDGLASAFPGGKLPWHMTASDESPFSPGQGQWRDGYTPEGRANNQYTPSLESLSAPGYKESLARYFAHAEAPDGNELIMPVFKKR